MSVCLAGGLVALGGVSAPRPYSSAENRFYDAYPNAEGLCAPRSHDGVMDALVGRRLTQQHFGAEVNLRRPSRLYRCETSIDSGFRTIISRAFVVREGWNDADDAP